MNPPGITLTTLGNLSAAEITATLAGTSLGDFDKLDHRDPLRTFQVQSKTKHGLGTDIESWRDNSIARPVAPLISYKNSSAA
jgi:hypothetical protein